MTQLYLIRHARTQMMGDVAARWLLSEKGRRDAGTLARQDFWRQIDLIFSSPESKAWHTAKPAARRWGIPLKIAECLIELRRPRLVQEYEQTVERLFANPEASIADMEPAAQAAERITRCLKDLVAAHPQQTLAAVSHGLVLTLFLAQLEDRWPTIDEWRSVPFTGMIVVDTNLWRPIGNWSSISKMP
ncbi:MAG: histidine phosphatase family protein [Chloroflexi bacterium]|nr:histidine phosphatase family protein [Chloroflexota bacterium]